MPPPKVESAVIRLKMLSEPRVQVACRETFFKTVRAAFGKRRKTLLNSLSDSGLKMNKQAVLQALTQSDIDPSRRAETLSIEEFARLSNAIESIRRLEQ